MGKRPVDEHLLLEVAERTAEVAALRSERDHLKEIAEAEYQRSETLRSRVEKLEALDKVKNGRLHAIRATTRKTSMSEQARLDSIYNLAVAALAADTPHEETDDDGHISRDMMRRFHAQPTESED